MLVRRGPNPSQRCYESLIIPTGCESLFAVYENFKGDHGFQKLDLMADGAHRIRSYRVEKSGVVAVL